MERLSIEHFGKASLANEHMHRYQFVAQMAFGRVVDCACGIGYASEIVASNERVSSYIGVDPSSEAISVARMKFSGERRAFFEGVLEDAPIEDGSVDTFLSLETLEHVVEPRRAIEGVIKKLAPNGVFIGSVPSAEYESACESVYGVNPYHIQRFSVRDLCCLLQEKFECFRLFSAEFGVATFVDQIKILPDSQLLFTDGVVSSLVEVNRKPDVLGSIIFLAGSESSVQQRMDYLVGGKIVFRGVEKIQIDAEEIKPLEEAFARSEAMIRDRDVALKSQKELIEARWSVMENMDKMVQTRDSQIESLKRSLDAANKRLAVLSMVDSIKSGDLQGRKALLEVKQHELNDLQPKLIKFENEAAQLAAKLRDYERASLALSSELEVIRNQKESSDILASQLEKRFVFAESILHEQERELRRLADELKSVVSQRDVFAARVESAVRQVADLEMHSGIVSQRLAFACEMLKIKMDMDPRLGAGLQGVNALYANFRQTCPFPSMVLVIYIFCRRLRSALKARGQTEVYFLAREGYLLKEAFDFYQRAIGDDSIRTYYLKVSRRSTFLMSLRSLDCEDFEILFRQYRKISVMDFLQSLSLDDISLDLARDLGCGVNDLSVVKDDLPTDPLFARVKSSCVFVDFYESRRVEVKQAFFEYFKGLSGGVLSTVLNLVDVGWKGTIQDNLFNLFDRNPEFGIVATSGYYMGLVAPGLVAEKNEKQGLLFSCVAGISEGFHVFNENKSVFEMILHANHGSARSYVVKNKAEVVEDQFVEGAMIDEKIRPVSDSIMAEFRKLVLISGVNDIHDDVLLKLVIRRHAKEVFSPSDLSVSWMLSVFHVENFGVFLESTFSHDNPSHGVFERLKLTRKIFARQPLGLGFWPWLTMKQMAFPGTAELYAVYRRYFCS